MDNAKEKLDPDLLAGGLHGYISEGGRLHIQYVLGAPDTYIYEVEKWLKSIGCTEIQTFWKVVDLKFVEGNPFFTYWYEASGCLPLKDAN